MPNEPSQIKYLRKSIESAKLVIRNSKIEDYKKNFFIKCTPSLERLGSSSDALEKVTRLMEKVCDGTYNLRSIEWVHDTNALLSCYSKIDGKKREASILLKEGEEIEAKIKEQGKNNLLTQNLYFQHETRGDLTSLL